MTKRKDAKGRNLRDNEYQKKDGRYEYRFYDVKSQIYKSVYSWRLVESDSVPAGKRKCQSLRELEKQIEKDIEDGIVHQKKITLDDFFADYIEHRVLKASTKNNYIYMYNHYIAPTLGKKNIAAIKYSDVKRLLLKLINDGFKPNSVEIVHTILHPIFADAVRDDLIRKNPTDGVMKDIKTSVDWTKERKHPLSIDEQSAFIDFVAQSEVYRRWLPLFTVMLGTGCRIGEMLGLCWENVDFSEGIINIDHAITYRPSESGLSELHISTPKTQNGVRVIPMLSGVKEALLTIKRKQLQEGGMCTDVVDGYSGFIWRNRYGNILKPHDVNRVIDRIVSAYNSEEKERAGVEKREPVLLPKFSAHILRHTFCTRLCENETDLKLIQEIMGHADITTTMDIYNESNTTRKKASFERLNDVMKIS